ncbi:MAG: hypothetical protein RIC07_27245, partial [Coleofasciculus sp. E1-EBD-02]
MLRILQPLLLPIVYSLLPFPTTKLIQQPLLMVNLPTQTDPPLSPRQTLPTMYDLPSDNPEEPGLPDEFHFLQPL